MTFDPEGPAIHSRSIDQISARLLKFVRDRVPDDEPLSTDTDLLETELLDSLLIMDLVAHAESAYGAKLENTDIAPRNFRTIDALARLIVERQS